MKMGARILLFCLLLALPIAAQDSSCPVVKMAVEQLPDLNIPRASHQLFCANGEYVVAGGHTDGFVPTPTAEYFKDGRWHLMQMVYNHDLGCSTVLRSGKVLLAGGCPEPLGIGQSFVAEMYDPVTHSFSGFACMDQKRAGASALELSNGYVVIAGNWYHDDTIELFDGKKTFTHVKGTTVGRSGPFIFLTTHDDAIIFGGSSTKGDAIRCSVADRLKDGLNSIPLFERWHPIGCHTKRSAESFIGDMAKNLYTYLVAVMDSAGRVAIAKVENGNATLLPTLCPVPMTTKLGDIEYYSNIVADQKLGRAYLMGRNADLSTHPEKGLRHYVLRIDYADTTEQKSAPLTLYYSAPMHDVPDFTPTLTPDGQLLVAGGLTTALSNFAPSRHAYLLHVTNSQANLLKNNGGDLALWVWLALLAAAITIVISILVWKHRQCMASKQGKASFETTSIIKENSVTDLMYRINELMELEKPYLNSELKVNDIANVFHVHRNDISACINSLTGCTFAQYVNRYRIDYAKNLMRQEPNKKISQIWIESGFGSEQTFFKAFRAATGMSPKEWMVQKQS
jgi:AraC-like DNA-binding protein